MEENEMERRGKVRDKMEKTTHKALKRGIFFSSRIYFKFFFSSGINEEFQGIFKQNI